MLSMGCVAMVVLAATKGGVEPTSAFAKVPGAPSDNAPFNEPGANFADSEVLLGRTSDLVPTRVMFIGDSQSDRLAYLMQMINKHDADRCPESYANPWGPNVVNHGEPGGCIIQQFGTENCTLCMKPTTFKSEVRMKTRGIIVKEKAPYVFVIDSNYPAACGKPRHRACATAQQEGG